MQAGAHSPSQAAISGRYHGPEFQVLDISHTGLTIFRSEESALSEVFRQQKKVQKGWVSQGYELE